MDWKKLGKKFYYGIFLEDEKYVDEIIIIIFFWWVGVLHSRPLLVTLWIKK